MQRQTDRRASHMANGFAFAAALILLPAAPLMAQSTSQRPSPCGLNEDVLAKIRPGDDAERAAKTCLEGQKDLLELLLSIEQGREKIDAARANQRRARGDIAAADSPPAPTVSPPPPGAVQAGPKAVAMTIPDAPLPRVASIIGAGERYSALLQLSDGAEIRVTPGQKLPDGGTVREIGRNGVLFKPQHGDAVTLSPVAGMDAGRGK